MRKETNYSNFQKVILSLIPFMFAFFSNCSTDSDPKIFFAYNLLQNSSSSNGQKYSIGGSVSGLSGTGLVIQNNGADNINIPGNGNFTFANLLSSNSSYSVSILTNPVSPTQNCTVANGTGTITNANITNVSISCSTSNTNLVYTGSPFQFTVNSAITTITPSVSGTINSCSANPSLPTGLSINNSTCAISGTPTVIQGATSYTITANTTNGNVTASIDITVNGALPAPSSLTYSSTNFTFKGNTAINTITPTVTGTVTSCSASPALPTGLSINNTTCAISGTPTVNQGATNYTITATNASGSTTANISITIITTLYRIFVTASAYNGDLKTAGGGGDGAAGADNLCNSDANKPAGSSYKAILFDSANRTATPPSNWVLLANTTYVRASDSATIFTTNASRISSFGNLTNSFDSGAQKEYWTGFRGVGFEWQLGLYRCNDWTNGTNSQTGRFGLSDALDYDSISTGVQNNCNLTKYLLCAEQ